MRTIPATIRNHGICLLLAGAFLLSPRAGEGALIFGPTAADFFDSTVQNHGDTRLDFTGMLGGALYVLGGVTFQSVTYVDGGPRSSPIHMVVSFYPERAGTICGTPYEYGSDDGRVGYEIILPSPVPRAGLLRIWTPDTLTEFYNASGVLLASHANTVNTEFVGWNTTSTDTDQWVSMIKVDTISTTGRAVGYSDDVTFGTAIVAIPEPLCAALLTGLAGLAFTWIARSRKHGTTLKPVSRI